MSNEEFKIKVMTTVETIIAGLGSDAVIIKPIIGMAKPILKRTIDRKPQEVYEWLTKAQKEIEETLKLYEDENNEMSMRSEITSSE